MIFSSQLRNYLDRIGPMRNVADFFLFWNLPKHIFVSWVKFPEDGHGHVGTHWIPEVWNGADTKYDYFWCPFYLCYSVKSSSRDHSSGIHRWGWHIWLEKNGLWEFLWQDSSEHSLMKDERHPPDHPTMSKWVHEEKVEIKNIDGAYSFGKACSGEVIVGVNIFLG